MSPVDEEHHLSASNTRNSTRLETSTMTTAMTRQLLKLMVHELDDGFSNFTCALYDTAWVAMVSKPTENGRQWAFPKCFSYLISQQGINGGWPEVAGYSDADKILNALAALLALQKHRHQPMGLGVPTNIESRVINAHGYVQHLLLTSDIMSSDRVGMEILIPAHVTMLEAEGLHFDWPQLPAILALRDEKMSRFRPELLYRSYPLAILHSLEAFIGLIDFDKVSHHMTSGSLMGSPSSTAAYLMSTTSWDNEAEAYLERVIRRSSGNSSGAVPSAFPTHVFEITWVVSTLLHNGFTADDLGKENLRRVADYLENIYQTQQGVVGFAPEFVVDADDTAKTIVCLNLLGRKTSPDSMISMFETGSHFKTYLAERNPSFSANCNALDALLHSPDPTKFEDQIKKTAKFLCDLWYNGRIHDKWNTAPQYAQMLLVQTFVRLLHLTAREQFSLKLDEALTSRIYITVFQVLMRTLQTQNIPGHWEGSLEMTAYATLALVSAASLPFTKPLGSKISEAVAKARSYLGPLMKSYASPEHIWIEKVAYGNPVLCQAYVLAAMRAEIDPVVFIGPGHVRPQSVQQFCHFFSELPLFQNQPSWLITASVIEGQMFTAGLREASSRVFPRSEGALDAYLEYIPFTWTLVNNINGSPFTAGFLRDMMIVSAFIYQSDEFMEGDITQHFRHDIGLVKGCIERACKSAEKSKTDASGAAKSVQLAADVGLMTPASSSPEPDGEETNIIKEKPDLVGVELVIKRFISFMLDHPRVKSASEHDRGLARLKLEEFLLAHCTQIEDNYRLSARPASKSREEKPTSPFLSDNPRSYHQWIRRTSAIHTSTPFSFALVACFLHPHDDIDFFPTAELKYLAESLIEHLAAMCRQYNDFGSVDRDKREGNLNSLDWPELAGASKQDLLRVADFERSCLEHVKKALLEKAGSALVRDAVKVFVDVTDMYGQIYVHRDLSNRMA